MDRSAIRLALFVATFVMGGCARPPRVVAPRVDAAALAREADAEVARGCYLCLRSAASKYEEAQRAGLVDAAFKAASTWTLVALRERELGLANAEGGSRLRRPPSTTDGLLQHQVMIVKGLPFLAEGVSRAAIQGAGSEMRSLLSARLTPQGTSDAALFLETAKGGLDPAASYILMSLRCAGLDGAALGPPIGPGPSPSALMAFGFATCRDRRNTRGATEELQALIAAEPRFHEVHYFLGRRAIGEQKLLTAEKEFLAAANGLPQMGAAWVMLGATRMALEEYVEAVADFGRALSLEPDQADALLGQAKALTYAGRFEEATVPAQRLLDLGDWYFSDANHWLAVNELQLGRLDAADRHVRDAQRTNPLNGDVARLAGLVAYRRTEMDRAQEEFELALSKSSADCEARYHLGLVQGLKGKDAEAVRGFVLARDCYARQAMGALARRDQILASTLSESRKEAALARVARRVADYRRSQAWASYQAAETEAHRGGLDAALGHAEAAAVETELQARITDLKSRIATLRAQR